MARPPQFPIDPFPGKGSSPMHLWAPSINDETGFTFRQESDTDDGDGFSCHPTTQTKGWHANVATFITLRPWDFRGNSREYLWYDSARSLVHDSHWFSHYDD